MANAKQEHDADVTVLLNKALPFEPRNNEQQY